MTSFVQVRNMQSSTTSCFHTNEPATFSDVCLVAASLGFLMGTGAILGLLNLLNCWQLWLYLFFFGYFHLAEFYVTARFNGKKLSMSSFLLKNGASYFLAHLMAVSEALYSTIVFRDSQSRPKSAICGLTLIILGQLLRSYSMVHAAQCFSHEVAMRKKTDHELVEDGPYAWFRHPSYTGYYMWAIGTQLLLGNRFSLLVFALVLYIFFKNRIVDEEERLTEFFGNKYSEYRNKTHSGIPFVR